MTRLDRIAELLLEALACPDPGEAKEEPKPVKKPRRVRKEEK